MVIYGTPNEIKIPKVDWVEDEYDYDTGLFPDEQRYVNDLKSYCRRNNEKSLIGEVIKFQVGDGFAQYMVANLTPVELIHLEVGDKWQSDIVHNITAKGIRDMIAHDKAMQKLYSTKL